MAKNRSKKLKEKEKEIFDSDDAEEQALDEIDASFDLELAQEWEREAEEEFSEFVEEEVLDQNLPLDETAYSPFRAYRNDMARSKILKNAEEIELIKRAAEGDLKARNEIIVRNLPLVLSIVKKYADRSHPYLDNVQNGNEGLIKATEKFDYQRGYKFSTYATWWIRQRIERGIINEGRTIRLPVHIVHKLNKANRVRVELFQKLKRKPTIEEVAEGAGINPDKLKHLDRMSDDLISLEAPLGDRNATKKVEDSIASRQIDAQSVAIIEEKDQMIGKMLSELTKREERVVRMRFGIGDDQDYTLKEVGIDQGGLSKERIRQIQRKVLRKLKQSSPGKRLKQYLDLT